MKERKVLCTRCNKGEARYHIQIIWKGRLQNPMVSCGNRDNGCPWEETENLQIVMYEPIETSQG